MVMQLVIESFLIETLTQIAGVKVCRIVRKVSKYIADRQLEFNFSAPPEGLYKKFKRLDKATGKWVDDYSKINCGRESKPGVGHGNNHTHYDLVLVNTLDHSRR